jgi:hypothetical protein
MPNRFRPFYTSAYRLSGIKLSLRVDLPQFRTLSALCENIHPGFPPLPPNWRELAPQQRSIQVNACFQGWLDSVPTELGSNLPPLMERVTLELIQQFRQDTIDPTICRLWKNYYTNTCYRAVFQIWNTRGNYLPHLKTPDNFYSLLADSYDLFSRDQITGERHNWIESPNWMLRGFNLNNSPVSISALTTWSRATITNALCSRIRESEDPYFMLSPLGVVTNTRTTYTLIEDALNSSDCPEIIRETVRKGYPNPDQEGLRREISNQIINHLCGSSIDEQFDRSQIQVRQFQRARILVQSLKTYLGDSPLAVNQLLESDFAEIGNFYQQRLASLSGNESQLTFQLSSSAIELFVRSIGTIVQTYVNRINDPTSIHNIIGGSDIDMTGEDILEDEDLISPIDWVYLQYLQEKYSELYEQIDLFCQLPPDTHRISHQQILWLRYGLKLHMVEIGDFINIYFERSPGPGGASLQVQQARTALVISIHQALNSSESLIREDAIKYAIECLEQHFLLVLRGLFTTVIAQLNIESSMVLLEVNRNQFLNFFTAEIERMSRLNHRNDISQAAIEKIVKKLLIADT